MNCSEAFEAMRVVDANSMNVVNLFFHFIIFGSKFGTVLFDSYVSHGLPPSAPKGMLTSFQSDFEMVRHICC
jgi:hypothetical protein